MSHKIPHSRCNFEIEPFSLQPVTPRHKTFLLDEFYHEFNEYVYHRFINSQRSCEGKVIGCYFWRSVYSNEVMLWPSFV